MVKYDQIAHHMKMTVKYKKIKIPRKSPMT